MKATITHVLRISSQAYSVLFSCGHRRTVPKSDFEREQWFIGKAVKCLFCTSQGKTE